MKVINPVDREDDGCVTQAARDEAAPRKHSAFIDWLSQGAEYGEAYERALERVKVDEESARRHAFLAATLASQTKILEAGIEFWRIATLLGWVTVLGVLTGFALFFPPNANDWTHMLLHYIPRALITLGLSCVVYAFPTRNYKNYRKMAERGWAIYAALASGDKELIAATVSEESGVVRNMKLVAGESTERIDEVRVRKWCRGVSRDGRSADFRNEGIEWPQ